MAPEPTRSTTDLQVSLQLSILRVFFGSATLVGLLGTVAAPLLGGPQSATTRWVMVLGYGLLAALAAVGTRLPLAGALRLMGPLLLASFVLVGSVGALTGWGLQVPGLSFFAVAVSIAFLAGPPWLGPASLGTAIAVPLALGLADKAGWLQPAGTGAPPMGSRLVILSAAIVTGALAGRAAARLLRQHLVAAQSREQRFRTLLGIATTAYWELDADLRFTQASWRDAAGDFKPLPHLLGHPPWALPGQPLDAARAAELQATLAAHAPLRDLPFAWDHAARPPAPDHAGAPAGSTRHYLASGEPRFSASGQFVGYWGVARDVTAGQLARQALERSQTLLARVVSTSPDVITLTELPSGRYAMVNDSFSRLLGYPASEAVGRSALELGLWRDPGQRVQMGQAAAEHGRVQDVLVDFVSRSGRVVPVMMSCTRFESEGQAYMLTNARDMSEATRVRLEREAILTNASVGIAFTRNRRFEMANTQFERMFGWPAGGLVGQAGRVVWASDADYAALDQVIGPQLARGEAVDVERQAMRHDGSVFLMRMRAKAVDPSQPAESGTIWIAEDVTAQRQAERDLARARDDAEAASRAKSAFLANMSHEIRTPLNGLTGLARLAQQPGVPAQRLGLYLTQIGHSADQLSAIISDILDVAKIEAGKLALESAPFDLPALLQSLQQAYGALAASQGLAFEAHFDATLAPRVRGDALRVRQILANFLQNALKFTPAGSVRLEARPLPGGRVRFEVHDSGPGIDEATQARLFRPFTQADESTTRRFGGTGLGLSICRELALLMGGSVGLNSRPGAGSCFHAELPLPAAPAGAAEAAPGEEGDPRLHGVRVLMVEDNSVNMMIGVALLEQWGLQVSEAADGTQALAAVARAAAEGRPFGLVLMDLQMPGISGYETTATLRRQYSAAQLPVIALTAAALVSERDRARAIGMNDFLTKPIDPQRLQAALLQALIGGGDDAAPPPPPINPA